MEVLFLSIAFAVVLLFTDRILLDWMYRRYVEPKVNALKESRAQSESLVEEISNSQKIKATRKNLEELEQRLKKK